MIRADRATQLGAGIAAALRPAAVGPARPRARDWLAAALRRSIVHAALGIAILTLAAAAGLWLAGSHWAAAWVAALGLGIGAGWAVSWVIIRSVIDRPLDRLARTMESLAAQDLLGLADTIADVSRGEPTRPLEVNATPVAVTSTPSVGRIADALNTTIQRLHSSAVLYNLSVGEPCRRLFYVGPDDYLQGSTCAEAMATRTGGPGEVLILAGLFRHTGMELRRRGFEAALRERYPQLQVVGTLETNYDPQAAYELTKRFLRTHRNLTGIYCTEGVAVRGAVQAIAEAGVTGQVVVVCHDLVTESVPYVVSGAVAATITQDPFAQGHDTAIHLFNYVACGWRPPEPRIVVASSLVTRDNYTQFWRPGVGPIDTPGYAFHRSRPMAMSSRPVKLAILGIEDNEFWVQVREGVLAAASELEPYNGVVEWIVPERDDDAQARHRGAAMEQLVQDGYEGIATPIYEQALVPYINGLVEHGVCVATFNSESSSLEGLVVSLSRQRQSLEVAASRLEVAAYRDALTGAGNRRLMDEELEQLVSSVNASGESATLVMIDLDQFKAYNDANGHSAGDQILRLVAQGIQGEIRPSDRLYRFGGEEFLVVLRTTTLSAGRAVAERIARAIADLKIPLPANAPWGVLTVSAGVSAVHPGCTSINRCIADADQALYQSKAAGRNRVTTHELTETD